MLSKFNKPAYSSGAYRKSTLPHRFWRHKRGAFEDLLAKISALLIFGGLVYLVFFSSAFRVKNILISGNKTVNESAVREITDGIANRKILKIFGNNLLFINAAEIRDAVKNRFGNISGVSVIKNFPQTLKIEIQEKPIDIAWCNRIKIERVANPGKKAEQTANVPAETAQCYFSDENNVIYEKTGDEIPAGSVKVFRDERINIGDKIGDDRLKDFIRELAGSFSRKTGLTLNYLYLPPISERELHLITGDGWKIYFDLNRDINDQLWILASALKSQIPEAEKKIMDYIDLRVIDRINYKTK